METPLEAEFFQFMHTRDPLTATQLGLSEFDALVPEVGREAEAEAASRFDRFKVQAEAQLAQARTTDERVNWLTMAALARGARDERADELWARNASAQGYVHPQSKMFQSVPAAVIGDEEGLERYLTRLAGLPRMLDDAEARYLDATRRGLVSTERGVRQALDQLRGHLALGLQQDTFVTVPLPTAAPADARERIARLVADELRPAIARLAETLGGEPLDRARGDAEVGLCHQPGGEEAYGRAVRRHTTVDRTPEEIHQLGLATLARLDEEWAELGSRVLGVSDRAELFDRLRNDPSLRFDDASEIVSVVTAALRRAEAGLGGWFPARTIAPCVVEEINPVEAHNAALAYYRGPSEDGTRPGAHCVLTTLPKERFRYEYEALAFHESVPGHHLQIGTAQTLTHLPRFRRYLDAEVCAYVEGWGLYAERLADEMGLYSSDLTRLGMLSFEALRACRLVVDTGMHAFGWDRARAWSFMWEHCATNAANVDNEIDRYIGWPGQALAYMVGRVEIGRLRERAQARLGAGFDMARFHDAVLSQGAVPLAALEEAIDAL